jgi:hypothetical protein
VQTTYWLFSAQAENLMLFKGVWEIDLQTYESALQKQKMFDLNIGEIYGPLTATRITDAAE